MYAYMYMYAHTRINENSGTCAVYMQHNDKHLTPCIHISVAIFETLKKAQKINKHVALPTLSLSLTIHPQRWFTQQKENEQGLSSQPFPNLGVSIPPVPV